MSVLAAIQRASKVLRRDVKKDDKAWRNFLMLLQTAAYSTWSILRDLRAIGLDAELVVYTADILDAVEVITCEEILESASCQVCPCV